VLTNCAPRMLNRNIEFCLRVGCNYIVRLGTIWALILPGNNVASYALELSGCWLYSLTTIGLNLPPRWSIAVERSQGIGTPYLPVDENDNFKGNSIRSRNASAESSASSLSSAEPALLSRSRNYKIRESGEAGFFTSR